MTRKSLLGTDSEIEKALLLGVEIRGHENTWPLNDSMEELHQLAEAAGAEVIGKITQRLESPSPSYYIGTGKLQTLISLKQSHPYTVAIFNDELSPRQQRNLEKILQVKVIDRTALILDIFAKRAHTREGQLQVELAQHRYLLPRLAGQWSHLERLGGGIGTRGPGESQLETDRRLIKQRIHRLEQQLEAVRKHRQLYRQKRQRSQTPVVALVGYTNAGKSTLLNALSQANVVAENKPFSTLDPVTRRLTCPNGLTFLLTDTVGFIHKLPPSIIAAFRATLEELEEADLILHVVDITHHNAVEQYRTVENILEELGLQHKPRFLVINKIDILLQHHENLSRLPPEFTRADKATFLISALKGWYLDNLLAGIARQLEETRKGKVSVSHNVTFAT